MKSRFAGTRYVRIARLRRQAIVGRVLNYLDSAEDAEGDPWLADDIRIARNAVLNASNGVADPWGFAFWWYFGKTYSKALILWAERARKNQEALERCAAASIPDYDPQEAAHAEMVKASRTGGQTARGGAVYTRTPARKARAGIEESLQAMLDKAKAENASDSKS